MNKSKWLVIVAIVLNIFPVSLTGALSMPGNAQVLGAGTPAVVQSCTSGHYAANASCALSNLNSGNTLVAVGYSSALGAALSISGCGLIWTNVFSDAATSNFTWGVWTAQVSGASCSPIQTINVSNFNFLNLMEVSGIGALDVVPVGIHPAYCLTCSSNSLTTNTSGDLVLFSGFLPNLQQTFSNFSNGFSIDQQQIFATESGGSGANVTAHLVQSAAGAISTTYTLSGATGNSDSILMAFKPASGGGGGGDITAPTTPAAPSLTVVSLLLAINLSWAASTDNVSVAGYKIFRNGSQAGISLTTNYSDTGLSASTQYTYTVSAYDAANNNSSQSAAQSATTQTQAADAAPPTTPTNLSATAISSSAINLSWTASTDAVGVSGYKIFRNGSLLTTTNSQLTTYLDSGLAASTNHSYTVSAYDVAGNNSAQSNSSSATTQAPPPPPPSGTYPWSGILSSSRATDWSKSGLPSSIIYGSGGAACNGSNSNGVETTPNPWTPPTRVQSGSTINCTNSVSDFTNIQNAINAALPGSFILVTGTCNMNGGTLNLNRKGVSLRGTGAQTAKLTGSASFNIDFGNAFISQSGMLSAVSYAAGTNQVVLTNATGNPPINTPAMIQQCDTGWSGPSCTTPTTGDADPGTVFVCGTAGVCSQSGNGGTHGPRNQQQYILVTGVNGNCSSSCTVTFSPGLYMPNWSSGNTATMIWATSASGWSVGNSLENLTVMFPNPTSDSDASNGVINTDQSYAWWITGVRMIGTGAGQLINISGLNGLFAHNYVAGTSPTYFRAAENEPVLRMYETAVLILNNIVTGGNAFWGNGPIFGEVIAYNYSRDGSAMLYLMPRITHLPTSGFDLAEGNQIPQDHADNTHGTNNLESMFRSYLSGWDPPYYALNPWAVSFHSYNRFYNYIGSVMGGARTTGYQGSSAGLGYVWDMSPADALSQAALMRWGNVDPISGPRWCGRTDPSFGSAPCSNTSEVPDSVTMSASSFPNAATFQNQTPSSRSLPVSFFINNITAHLNGGTGLSWWKVCTNWTNFPSNCAGSQTQPFPAIGPDVTGGPYVNGYAYDVPAAVAFKYLPIDTSLQQSYAVTSSQWSNSASACGSHQGSGFFTNGSAPCEILTITKPAGVNLGNGEHLIGGFQLSGVNSACTPSGLPPNGEILMTASTYDTGAGTAIVVYSLANNPGVQCTGTFKFPNIRVFDAAVYQADSGGSNPPPPPPTPVPGDFNLDHIVNSLDYSLLNSNWFKSTNISGYDLQIDGIINSFDYAILKSNWGKTW